MAVAALLAFGFTSCEDQLDSINYTKQDTGNFPATSDDVVSELNGVYSVLNGFVTTPLEMPYMVWNLMSDDCNGAGGTGDTESHAVGHLTTNNENLYQNAWKHVYEGLNRASTIIYSIDNVEWANKTERDQLLGETLFMRALYLFWGTQMFGNIPAYWQPGCPTPCPQQDAETVIYPHILGDLVQAATLMTKKTQGDGHATKYAAEALLGRAYMFYQGFYKKAGELANANLAPVTIITLDGEQEVAGIAGGERDGCAVLGDCRLARGDHAVDWGRVVAVLAPGIDDQGVDVAPVGQGDGNVLEVDGVEVVVQSDEAEGGLGVLGDVVEVVGLVHGLPAEHEGKGRKEGRDAAGDGPAAGRLEAFDVHGAKEGAATVLERNRELGCAVPARGGVGKLHAVAFGVRS